MRIEALPWMEPATKAAALEKLAKLRRQDRLPVQVARLRGAGGDRGDLFGNWERVAAVRMGA